MPRLPLRASSVRSAPAGPLRAGPLRAGSLRAGLAIAFALSVLGACSPSDEGAGTPADPRPQARVEGAAAEGELPQSASTSPASGALPQTSSTAQPDRVFTFHAAELPAWYDELKRRVDPAQDGWGTEILARVARQTFEAGLVQQHRSQPSMLLESLGQGFRCGPLAPRELETRRDTSTGRVRVADFPALEGSALEADLAQELELLLEPFQNSPDLRVMAHVVQAHETSETGFAGRVLLRLAGESGGGNLQVNARWRFAWSVDVDQRRLFLTELAAERHEEVLLPTPPFAELTEHVLGATPFAAREQYLGAVEFDRRYDRTAQLAGVYLGMHGMAVGDVDGDGLEDVYVGRQAGNPNLLLLQQPDGTVRDGASAAEVDFLDDTAGVLIVDLDGDGARELLMGRGNDVVIAWNDGSGSFPRRSVLEGQGGEQVYSLCAADADGDGDLDLYATRYVTGGVAGGVPTPYHDANNGARNFYWRNDGDGFVLATAEVGLDVHNTRFSLAAMWEDFDDDGDPDLYVVNDFGQNSLFQNEGGHFTDIAAEVGAWDMAAGMGISTADVDLDGDIDAYVTNMFTAAGRRVTAHPRFLGQRSIEESAGYEHHTQGNSLLLNRGDGSFDDATQRSGSAPGGWAWGAMFTDFDGDGLQDLVVPNGFITGRDSTDLEGFFWRCVVAISPPAPPATEAYANAWSAVSALGQAENYSWNGRERNYAYWNQSGGLFVDASAATGLDYLDDARVACALDWDGDGAQDLWLKNRTAPLLRFLRGTTPPQAWIRFELAGVGKNRDAVGAKVVVRAGEVEHRRSVHAGEGYLGSSSLRLSFGLGRHPGPVDVRVTWPDGKLEEHPGLATGALYRIAVGGAPERVEGRAPSPLAEVRGRRLPARLPEGAEQRTDGAPERVARVPLLDTMPLGGADLPDFDTPGAKVSDHTGRALLILVWGTWSDASRALLEELGQRGDELERARLDVHPISMDSVRDEEALKAWIEGLGLAETGGRLDRLSRVLFEMVLFESLGSHDDIELPVGFLVDEAGDLVALYLTHVDFDTLLADVALSRAGLGQPGDRWRTALTGGRWVDRGPERALGKLRSYLRKAGFRDLVREIKLEQQARGE